MKLITSFNIDESNLSALSNLRRFSIEGEKDAEFMLQVVNSSQEFYNFSSKSFTVAFTSENNLSVKMKSDIYNSSIKFPASESGDVYTVLILTGTSKDTELSIGYGKNSYSTTITQVVNTTLTFTVATANTTKYTSWSSGDNIVSTNSSTSAISVNKTLDWTLTNANSDAHGFGLRLIRQPIDTDWYFQTTEVISSNPKGDAVSNNQVIVSDLTDIGTGMELIYHKGTTAPAATTVITAIDLSTKVITFSTSTAFEDGETMTLRAKGSSVIQKAIGANIDFSNFNDITISAVSAELTQTVRSDSSSTTITLLDTYGVSGGGFVTISGKGVINTSDNTVQTVSADAGGGGSDGLVVMQVAQTVVTGTKIYFRGSTQSIDIDNTFTIKSHPSTNKIIYLNLDNFITPGVAN